MSKRIDWPSAKVDYIANKDMTLEDVATKYGAAKASVLRISMREGWAKEKDKRWENATKDALEEVEGSLKDLLVRHVKVARFLQSVGVKNLQVLAKDLEANPKKLITKNLKPSVYRAFVKLVSEGLKAERELYPKQMQIKGELAVTETGMSPELEQAVYESFRTKLGRKRPSIHSSVSQKTKVKK